MMQHILDNPLVAERQLPMSYEEWREWVGDRHSEWVDGEAIVMMMATGRHQDALLFFATTLHLFVDWFGLGIVRVAPFSMRLSPGGRVRQPDLLFVGTEHRDRITDEFAEGPVDLALELISADSVNRDRSEKRKEYERGGIREYLIVDPRPGHESVELLWLDTLGVYKNAQPDDHGRFHLLTVPGYWFDPAWLWSDPLMSPYRALAMIAPDVFPVPDSRNRR
jgi:Uma2 family endonuclease